MSLLSYYALKSLLKHDILEQSDPANVNAASIDLVLGDTFWIEKNPLNRLTWGDEWPVIDMLDKNADHLEKVTPGPEGIVVPPGGTLLASTREVFNLPNWLSGEYKLKSTMARNFFNHMNAGWCFTGDTEVAMLDGTTKKISEVKQGDYVYSLSANGDIAPGLVSRSGISGYVKNTIRVTLDDGSSFECTPEHKIMLRDGSYKAAEHLTAGQALMPLKRKLNASGHELVYCPHISPKSNHKTLRGRYKPTHRLVAGDPEGMVVHHKDHNRTNNIPSNLEIMTDVEHNAIHCSERNKTDEMRLLASDRLKKRMKENWSNPEYAAKKAEEARAKSSEWNKKLWASQEHRDAMKSIQAENGRKVMAATDNEERQRLCKLGMVRNAIAKIVAAGQSVNEHSYVSFKRQNAPTVATLVNTFGSFDKAVAESGYANHHVVSVDRIEHSIEIPVYDLSMEGENHNFALACGVFVHNCDAGWHGSVLTLEFVNHNQYHAVRVRPGQKCGQMIFFRHEEVPGHASYATRGQYNGDLEATPGKGLK